MADTTSTPKMVTSDTLGKFWDNLETQVLPKKVDAEEGKGLSTNDLTDEMVETIDSIKDGLDASKLKGVVPMENLPSGVKERMYPVANVAAMKALTKEDVQNGDTVKLNDTGVLYMVKDDSLLAGEDDGSGGTRSEADVDNAFEPYKAGTAASVPWEGVTGTPLMTLEEVDAMMGITSTSEAE